MKNHIVLGSAFGDEGKGSTTSFLCQKIIDEGKTPLVLRFNAGGQAGHTVIHEGNRHIFSNFGSGSLQNVPTYWSEYCTVNPLGILNEYNALISSKIGLEPKLYVHPLCAVTTPYDKKFNCNLEKSNKHGSCGMGFGSTIQRQEDHYKLFVQDLFHEKILIEKLNGIRNYYSKKFGIMPSFLDKNLNIDIEDFLFIVNKIKDIITVDDGKILLPKHNLVFEGAQGILLDQDFGFFPNVTRSNTTSKNALKLINKYGLSNNSTEIYYITRAYQTRHGNGFMTNEDISGELKLINYEKETNVTNEFQGGFRKSFLDVDLLNYAFDCDSNFSKEVAKNLVVTCVDQTGENIKVTYNKELIDINVYELPTLLNTVFNRVYFSKGDSHKDINLVEVNAV
ncbi:MAG TPA: adenylosuccinate synthetase [Bacteroidia bacterium]|jgi:adenylosuccinate synthase|nr:adenylosuccinate synthetase [Bacteroidia bacterium]